MRIGIRKTAAFLLALVLMTGGVHFLSSGKAETVAFMHTIPVVMITADENDLWNETDGMGAFQGVPPADEPGRWGNGGADGVR